jgi:hypothetical protein
MASNEITGTTKANGADSAALATQADVAEYDGFSEALDGPQIARRLYNRSGTDASGARIEVDMFWDNASEETSKTINAIMVMMHRSRAWFQWDDASESNTFFCTSHDAVTGTLEDTGRTRACRTCPDAVWRKDIKGKKTVNCSEIRTVLCLDLATQDPFLLRFQRSSSKPIVAHLRKHHQGKGPIIRGRRMNLPLYSNHVTLSLERSQNGKYAVPKIVFGAKSLPEEIELARSMMEALRPALDRAVVDRSLDERGEADDSAGGDASFDPDTL